MIVAAFTCDWRRKAPVCVCGDVWNSGEMPDITNVLKTESNDTADAADCDVCGEQGKSFKTKAEREVLEVHVSRIMWRTCPLSGMTGLRYSDAQKTVKISQVQYIARIIVVSVVIQRPAPPFRQYRRRWDEQQEAVS